VIVAGILSVGFLAGLYGGGAWDGESLDAFLRNDTGDKVTVYRCEDSECEAREGPKHLEVGESLRVRTSLRFRITYQVERPENELGCIVFLFEKYPPRDAKTLNVSTAKPCDELRD
jgi:hypothetical protein